MKATATHLLAIGALALTTSAVAAPVVHDQIADFSVIFANQGKSRNSDNTGFVNVAADRTVLANMFDSNPATVFTLGLGGQPLPESGQISFVIFPTANLIGSGTLLTPGGRRATAGLIDFAELYLGNGGGSWQKVGKLGNDGSIDTTGGIAGVVLSAVADDTTASFSLTVTGGSYNSVQFRDVTPAVGANRDGFDIAAFSLTSDTALPVPTPGTLPLAALSLAGLWLMRRRTA
jgi:MYXO-CTERM domain-containing protein